MIEEDCATIKTTKGHQRVVEAFGLSPTRWWNKRQLNARNTWSTQDHLACLWDDLELVTAREGSTHPLFPVRIESLLLKLLAYNIKKESLDPNGTLELPHWSFRKRILTREMKDDKNPAPEDIIDYVLWYGHCWELETNMIIMKSDSPVPRSWTLLQNMSDIHHARKLAGRDAVIYGVITDGLKWVFIHLTNQSRYTIKVFAWDNERDQIIGQIQNIIDQAVALYRKMMSRSSLPTPTVHQISRCQIRELPAPCAGSDIESFRVTEQNACHTATIEEKAYNSDTDMGLLWW
ncbi:unnamed protein product [Penicillium nalgiovense]|uniref:Fungal-type protein kinase domain-containing protein n=1 Tax=Penicillium nalgiovense TaxID=60175 RepID=A0A1V6YGE4_PENNA|nr:hypothetical protein PENNAL_c0021G07599 [Penicillium nalgiovense]CAG7958036.1 unnamed protein product [Penicillium nalgiovense]CAG7982823.1 unnamed protein product [Penicillium nalgiovense]CAG8020715.1 unnamed protein product [Penicillium nalgiovense]CAG8060625.1 unnamed protein product [Penicillium nalgiovense]